MALKLEDINPIVDDYSPPITQWRIDLEQERRKKYPAVALFLDLLCFQNDVDLNERFNPTASKLKRSLKTRKMLKNPDIV